MIAYLDTSVLLRIVLGQRPELVEWDQLVEAIVNPLVEIECLRTLDRVRLTGHVSEEGLAGRLDSLFDILSRLSVTAITAETYKRAAQPFPTPLGTLDALHLASALIYRDSQPPDDPPIRFATHDLALARAARAMGFRVIGA